MLLYYQRYSTAIPAARNNNLVAESDSPVRCKPWKRFETKLRLLLLPRMEHPTTDTAVTEHQQQLNYSNS
jgi:hypothetical protein